MISKPGTKDISGFVDLIINALQDKNPNHLFRKFAQDYRNKYYATLVEPDKIVRNILSQIQKYGYTNMADLKLAPVDGDELQEYKNSWSNKILKIKSILPDETSSFASFYELLRNFFNCFDKIILTVTGREKSYTPLANYFVGRDNFFTPPSLVKLSKELLEHYDTLQVKINEIPCDSPGI